jgi:hypothetical protein
LHVGAIGVNAVFVPQALQKYRRRRQKFPPHAALESADCADSGELLLHLDRRYTLKDCSSSAAFQALVTSS